MISVWISRLAVVATLLAFVVVVLGAWTRLVDAGLGCPDWPGCYGFFGVPESADELGIAETRFPEAPVEAEKAWPEMIHRYFAGTLGLVVFGIAALALWQRRAQSRRPPDRRPPDRRSPEPPWRLGLVLAVLVVVQAAFGMWTVTLKLWPQVVTTHLLGGVATLSLLWWLTMRCWWDPPAANATRGLRRLAIAAFAITVLQVALGGWVSSNYAAVACPDFPTCQNAWWPEMDLGEGFDVTQGVGPNYLGGLMDNEARVAIHMMHRLGALATAAALIVLAVALIRHSAELVSLGVAVLVTLCVQIGLGIANVVGSIPLGVATAHNATGALLLLVMVTVSYRLFNRGVS